MLTAVGWSHRRGGKLLGLVLCWCFGGHPLLNTAESWNGWRWCRFWRWWDVPQAVGGVVFANDDHLSVFVDFDVVFGEESDAVIVT
jgi:hypothetical protein